MGCAENDTNGGDTHLREVCTCVNLIGITGDVDKSEAYGWTQSVMDSLHTLLFCY